MLWALSCGCRVACRMLPAMTGCHAAVRSTWTRAAHEDRTHHQTHVGQGATCAHTAYHRHWHTSPSGPTVWCLGVRVCNHACGMVGVSRRARARTHNKMACVSASKRRRRVSSTCASAARATVRAKSIVHARMRVACERVQRVQCVLLAWMLGWGASVRVGCLSPTSVGWPPACGCGHRNRRMDAHGLRLGGAEPTRERSRRQPETKGS